MYLFKTEKVHDKLIQFGELGWGPWFLFNGNPYMKINQDHCVSADGGELRDDIYFDTEVLLITKLTREESFEDNCHD